MQETFPQNTEYYTKQNQRRRIWKRFVRVIACIVVFCTTYTMILPAITMEKQQCELEEHTHSDSCYEKVISETTTSLVCTYESLGIHVHSSDCYDAEHHLICRQADYIVHTHNAECKNADGTIVCALPKVSEHEHDENCYSVKSTNRTEKEPTVHYHDDNCYALKRGELTCQLTETAGHSHEKSCFGRGELTCRLDEQDGHTHGKECSETVLACELTTEPHHHDDDCYRQLVCELPEDETHTHSEECNGKVLNCDLTEQPHNHKDSCYRTNSLCDLPESEGHAHGDACYESVLECELTVEEAHTHTDSCYEQVLKLNCGLEEGSPAESEAQKTNAPETAEPELVCEKDVIQLHSHKEETCYEILENGNRQLICTELEVLEHIHTESCFVTKEFPREDADKLTCTLTEGHTHADACYDDTGALICEEAENHTHGSLCYGTWELICSKEEHTHSEKCRTADGTEETIPTADSIAGIEGALTQAGMEEMDLNAGISLMSLLPRTIDGEGTIGNINWTVSHDERGEYYLTFSGSGALPYFGEQGTFQPGFWKYTLNALGNPYVHLEFGESVTSVGSRAIEQVNIKSIVWGGITKLDTYAFIGGNGPEVLTIPGQIQSIGNYAFSWRTNVNQIILEDGIKELGIESLDTGNGTSTLVIPASVTYIAGNPMTNVDAYVLADGDANKNFRTDAYGALYTKSNPVDTRNTANTLLGYPRGRNSDVFAILPGTVSIASRALATVNGIGKVVIPSSVKSLGANCFEKAKIGEIYLEDGISLTTVSQLTSVSGLTNIRYPEGQYPEGTNVPLYNLLNNNTAYGRYTHLTVPSNITTISKLDGHVLNMETVTYNAANATIENFVKTETINGEQVSIPILYSSCSKYDLIIGNTVNNLPSNFARFAASAKSVSFRGPNTFSVENGAFSGAGMPLEGLSGNFYADANGVLYQYTDDGTTKTAKVVYASADVASDLSIPATIPVNGESYTVTAVGSYAFSSAKSLVSLTFHENALNNITVLDDYAMANCPTLQSVNGATTEAAAKAKFSGVSTDNMGKSLFSNTGLDPSGIDSDDNGVPDSTGRKNLAISSSTTGSAVTLNISLKDADTIDWSPAANGSGMYQVRTGNNVTVNIASDNTTSSDDYKCRVYFRYTGDYYPLGKFVAGYSPTFGNQTAICYATEDPNVIYVEFAPVTGATGGFSIPTIYPAPESAGGSLEIWGIVMPKPQAEDPTNIGKVIDPSVSAADNIDDIIHIQWTTHRSEYAVKKTGAEHVNIVTDGKTGSDGTPSGKGKPASSLNWTISMTRTSTPGTDDGYDYVKSAIFTDIITLPDGCSWNPDLIKALQGGSLKFMPADAKSDDLYIGDCRVARIARGSNAIVKLAEAYWHQYISDGTQKGTMAIRWAIDNTAGATEIGFSQTNIVIYPEAITVDLEDLHDGEQLPTIHNVVTADLSYHYSSDDSTSADASTIISGGESQLIIQKTTTKAPTYFGEDITYHIDLYNNGVLSYVGNPEGLDKYAVHVTDTLSVHTYIKPENMQAMFQKYGSNLTISIKNAIVAPWTEVTPAVASKTEVYKNTGNSNMGSIEKTVPKMTITYKNNKYHVGFYNIKNTDTGETDTSPTNRYEGTTVAEALYNAGYAVTMNDQYVVDWKLHETDADDPTSKFVMLGGEKKPYEVYATVKDTFSMLSRDWPSTTPYTDKVGIENYVAPYFREINNTGEKGIPVIPGASVTNSVKREAWVDKSVYRGQNQLAGSLISIGDVLTYHLDFHNYGTGSYKNLPMVDDMYGSQYLLVPVNENSGLSAYNLPIHNDSNVDYYVLTEGTYTDVTVGVHVNDNGTGSITRTNLIAATITVEKVSSADNGIHTAIKWYFPEVPGNYTLNVEYKALVDSDQTGGKLSIGNTVWMNDRVNTRIYSSVNGGGTIIDFNKDIIIQKGDTYAGDSIEDEKYSPIANNHTVTYRLKLHNTSDHPFVLKGADLGDALPQNFGKFQWNKDENVFFDKVEVVGDGINVLYQDVEYGPDKLKDTWSIGQNYGGRATEKGQYYIVWPNNLEIHFSKRSTLYLYFTLHYPDGDVWSQYVKASNGEMVSNTLYVYDFPITAHHDLFESGEVWLQKGVSGLYHYGATSYYEGHGIDKRYRTAGTTRLYYNNRDMQNRAVHYYVVICNTGSTRLYLNDVYDKLPKGFTFMQMMNQIPKNLSSATNKNPSTTSHAPQIAAVSYGSENIVYRNALVTPDSTSSGVKFRFSQGEGNNPVRYDAEKGKCYLNSGEAIVFGYTCDVEYDTDPTATNVIGMPYDDYLNSDVQKSSVRFTASDPASIAGVFSDKNDGTGMQIVLNEDVSQYGFESHEGQKWLVSDVSLIRGTIAPGISKTVTGYSAYNAENGTIGKPVPYANAVHTDDVVHWEVTVRNTGTKNLVGYTFTDTLPAPYVFAGEISLLYYDAQGNEIRERKVGTLDPRTDGETYTKITLPEKGNPKLDIPLTGTWVPLSGQFIGMSLKQVPVTDSNGNKLKQETLTITTTPASVGIPEGGYMKVVLSSRNPTDIFDYKTYYNRAQFYPVETFDREYVNSGRIVEDEQGDAIGVETTKGVTVASGFSTSSEKRVTEISSGKTAVSTSDENSIVLQSAESIFTYTLAVDNITTKPMTKFVVIDNLPGIGDKMPFDPNVDRNSAFNVHFAANPMFAVNIITTDPVTDTQTSTPLDASQYSLEFSTATTFGKPESNNDWSGVCSETDKWVSWNELGTHARSFRLIITDSGEGNSAIIPAGSRIEISFNAQADKTAKSNTIAWNSFGYHYALKDEISELESSPDPVGVAMPNAPYLKKKLIDLDGNPVEAHEGEIFRFLVHEGAPPEGNYQSLAEYYAALNAHGQINYVTYNTLGMSMREHATEFKRLDLNLLRINWTHGKTYTVIEVEMPERFKCYDFYDMDNVDELTIGSHFTFTYDATKRQEIVCVNQLQDWAIKVTKTNTAGDVRLPGAVFGLYSPSETGRLTQAEAGIAPLTTEVTTDTGKETWYLKKIGTTGTDGVLLWPNLQEECYYLMEIKAPDGYNLPEENGQFLNRSTSVLEVNVTNEVGYELPDTGGTGTTSYTLGGLLMITAAILLYIHILKRRKEDLSSF